MNFPRSYCFQVLVGIRSISAVPGIKPTRRLCMLARSKLTRSTHQSGGTGVEGGGGRPREGRGVENLALRLRLRMARELVAHARYTHTAGFTKCSTIAVQESLLLSCCSCSCRDLSLRLAPRHWFERLKKRGTTREHRKSYADSSRQ